VQLPRAATAARSAIFTARRCELRVVAQQGGSADGTGGNGGSISDINFTVTKFARTIAAGDGGIVAAGGTAGTGGSISKVKIGGTGVIGDFTSDFHVNGDSDNGMGGLIAGLGGSVNGVFDISRNGAISNVTASRIAAIVAVAQVGNSLTSFNAVKSIAGLHVSVLGADVDGDGTFAGTRAAAASPASSSRTTRATATTWRSTASCSSRPAPHRLASHAAPTRGDSSRFRHSSRSARMGGRALDPLPRR